MARSTIRYPDISVRKHLHHFEMLSRVALALRRAKIPQKQIDRFTREAALTGTAGGIHDACARWIVVR